MSNDWLKVEIATPDKPEVFQIAHLLGIDHEAVFTKLFRVWSWFDQHSVNGNAPVTLRALLDSRANVTGFADAMEKVGWLIVEGDSLRLPNFDRHVGKSAKKRALAARRAGDFRKRNAKDNAGSNAPSVTDDVTKGVTENKNKKLKEAPVGAMSVQEQKDEFWKIGLPLLTSQGMEEKKARTFLGKAISQAGPAEGLAIMRLARESGDAAAYIAKCAVVPKLPTDNHELWELRAKLGLERYYDDLDTAHNEIRQRLREQPELRAAL